MQKQLKIYLMPVDPNIRVVDAAVKYISLWKDSTSELETSTKAL